MVYECSQCRNDKRSGEARPVHPTLPRISLYCALLVNSRMLSQVRSLDGTNGLDDDCDSDDLSFIEVPELDTLLGRPSTT